MDAPDGPGIARPGGAQANGLDHATGSGDRRFLGRLFGRLFGRDNGLGLALQHREEEPVGAVAGGRQREIDAAGVDRIGRRRAGEDVAPDLGHRHQMKAGMGGEEPLDLRLVLAPEQRAGGIGEPAAMLHQPRGALQDAPLQGHELVDVLGLQMPPGIGIAPPGAAAAAGRIQQHAVEAGRHGA